MGAARNQARRSPVRTANSLVEGTRHDHPDRARPPRRRRRRTGQQGGATARALLAAGADVRALVRDPDADPARDLRTAGATTVRADLNDPASLRAAFDGVAAVFAMTTFTGDGGLAQETEHGIAITDAAVAAGVPHLVYSSVGGAERHTGIGHFESKRRVEEYLDAAPIATTFVRPAFFMENLAVSDGVLSLPLPGGIPPCR